MAVCMHMAMLVLMAVPMPMAMLILMAVYMHMAMLVLMAVDMPIHMFTAALPCIFMGMAIPMKVLHIMIMILMFFIKNYGKITGVNPGLHHPLYFNPEPW